MARFLALDWDQNQLHIVLADVRNGVPQIRHAAVWPESQIPNPVNAEDLGKILRDRLKQAGIPLAPLLVCVGRDRMIVKEVRFPSVAATEEPAMVRFQTLKELTDAPEDVVIDYVVSNGLPGGEQKAAALVIRKEILQTYQALAAAAGLKLAGLTPRLLGSAACLRKVAGTTVVTPAPEPADGVICVVVTGEKQAEISILRNQSFVLARSVPVGSNLAGEIRRNLAVHSGQLPQYPVRAIYLAGKGAGELRERLGELVEDVPVHTFDPFAGADTPGLPVGNRGTFAGAMGLLHLKAAGDLPVNFVSPRQPKPPGNPNYRLIRLGLVAGVTLFVGLIILGRVLHASWSEELAQVERDRVQVEKELVASRENAKRLKAIDEWDEPVWLDELYDLTARITDVNELRITSITTEPLAPNAKSKAVARATIKGKLLARSNPRRALDLLVAQFGKDGFYTPEAPKAENDQFTLVVTIERRAPGDYTYNIKEGGKTESKKSSVSEKEKAKEEDAKGKSGKSRNKGKRVS